MIRLDQIRVVFVLLLFAVLAAGEGTKITAPKNKYSASDDVQLGKEAAGQVAREMPLLPENGDVDSYVESVGQALVAAIPPEFSHKEFRYEFSVVNASDINAFALPGGPMFVNRGMITAAHKEGEMAGVMAHEISHVALRHGTAQATEAGGAKYQLGALGGAILGAIVGGDVGDLIAGGTQTGLGVYLLKFSREYETQADVLGAQILARAGYDPMDLAQMFKTIENQGGSGGPQWLSSHPNPGNRQERISQEARQLSIAPGRRVDSDAFSRAQASLNKMAPAPSSADIAKNRKPESGNGGGRYPDDAKISTKVDPPSKNLRTFNGNQFQVSVPENWRAFSDGQSVTFAPDGAYGKHQSESVFTHGAVLGMVNAPSNDLEKASEQYISGILQGNAYLKAEGNFERKNLDGRSALKRRLSGKSPVTERKELVDVYTALADNGRMFYMVQVVPDNSERQYRDPFGEMVRSVRLSTQR